MRDFSITQAASLLSSGLRGVQGGGGGGGGGGRGGGERKGTPGSVQHSHWCAVTTTGEDTHTRRGEEGEREREAETETETETERGSRGQLDVARKATKAFILVFSVL